MPSRSSLRRPRCAHGFVLFGAFEFSAVICDDDAEVAAASADTGADDRDHDVITYSFVAVMLLAQMLLQMIVRTT